MIYFILGFCTCLVLGVSLSLHMERYYDKKLKDMNSGFKEE